MVASFWSPLGIAAVIGWLIYRHFVNLRARRNLPPGPKPLPIVGNALDFPGSGVPEFQHWLKHKDLYGGVSSVTVMGLTLIILHDNKAARYLLDQNAVVTSSRPSMYFANILCGYGDLLSNQNYGDTFRRYRKLLHRELGTKSSVLKFSESQEVEVKRQLLRALNEPEKWIEHYKT